jgi:hypothetical protein
MKKRITNHLMLLCGAAFLLVGCPGPEPTPEPTPKPPVVNPPDEGGGDKEENTGNRIEFGDATYDIVNAGTEVEGAVILYFETESGAGAAFGLYLDEGEMTLTKSQTFTYVDNPAIYEDGFTYSQGEPGTFTYGEFYTDDDSSMVTSGSIEVEVSDEGLTIEVDCVCEGDKELIIRYTGDLDYYGPSGTSTINVADTEFPYVLAFGYEPYEFEDFGLYVTEMWISGFTNLDGDIELDCELAFIHSTPILSAGIYNAVSPDDPDPSFADKLFIGYADVYDYKTDVDFGGDVISGRVNIAVDGDIYTITFEDVVLTDDLSGPIYDMSGTYTGRLVDENDYFGTASAQASPKLSKIKLSRTKGTRPERAKSLIETFRQK